MKIFNTNYSQFLKRALDKSSLQQNAISENLNNINIQGYKRKNTDFSEMLEGKSLGLMRTSSHKHMQNTLPVMGGETTDEEVNLTREMSDMAQNQIEHELAVRAMRRVYDGLKSAITGQAK